MLERSATLINPAMPAAASRWPRLVLTEPMRHGLSGRRSSASTAPSAFASIGSPSGVPVPCASTYWTSAGRDAGASDRLRAARLPARAVRRHQAVAAAVLIDGAAADDGVNRIAVGERCDSGFSTTTPAPSPRT